MKKIAFFVSAMGRGGAERVVSILSDYYVNMGVDVDICMLWHNINDYKLNKKINVIDLSCDNFTGIIKKIKMLKSLRNYIKNNDIDIIVPFLAQTAAVFAVATFGLNLTNKLIVSSERNDPYVSKRSPVLKYLINKAFNKSDVVVFQTESAKRYYSKEIQEKGVIVDNPVTMDLTNNDNGKHIIITGGRLEEQKNQELLIRAFGNITDMHREYELHIYGEGRLRDRLQSIINDLNLADRTFLKGNSLDYQKEVSNAEIFILTSNYEGLSNALLEALLMGKPCITTRCAGTDEFINNGVNGILVPIGDQRALEEALVKVIEDEEYKKNLGLNALNLKSRFSTDNVIDKWNDIFRFDFT